MATKSRPTLPKSSLAKNVALHLRQYRAGKAVDPKLQSSKFSAKYIAEWDRQCANARAGIFEHIAN